MAKIDTYKEMVNSVIATSTVIFARIDYTKIKFHTKL